MTPVKTAAQVFEQIQRAKAGATAFRTNFFPAQARLQSWIDHGEFLQSELDGVVFFVRKDRGFGHLHFCAPDLGSLKRGLANLDLVKREGVVVDLIGAEPGLGEIVDLMVAAGFRPYRRLVRLARPSQPADPPAAGQSPVVWAEPGDAPEVLRLLENAFDRYADQLPMEYELEAAVASRQILVARKDGTIGALLFFETQGLTSTVRYWVVAAACRASGLGSAVIRHYFASQAAVRRFILWVAATNDDAVAKYRHYGYAPDGLVDHILANDHIKS